MPNILFCALLRTVNKRQKGDGSITGEAHNYFQHRFSLPSEIPSFQDTPVSWILFSNLTIDIFCYHIFYVTFNCVYVIG